MRGRKCEARSTVAGLTDRDDGARREDASASSTRGGTRGDGGGGVRGATRRSGTLARTRVRARTTTGTETRAGYRARAAPERDAPCPWWRDAETGSVSGVARRSVLAAAAQLAFAAVAVQGQRAYNAWKSEEWGEISWRGAEVEGSGAAASVEERWKAEERGWRRRRKGETSKPQTLNPKPLALNPKF